MGEIGREPIIEMPMFIHSAGEVFTNYVPSNADFLQMGLDMTLSRKLQHDLNKGYFTVLILCVNNGRSYRSQRPRDPWRSMLVHPGLPLPSLLPLPWNTTSSKKFPLIKILLPSSSPRS